MQVNIYPILRGLASYILPISMIKRPGSGGTFSGKYCYSVWLRHLYYLVKNGLVNEISELRNIAEIGPGDSLGIGIAALYCGVSNYHAFDIIEHANLESNLRINSELKALFENKMDIPHGKGFEAVEPKLKDYTFPHNLLNFDSKFFTNRADKIARVLKGETQRDLTIKYIVPWNSGNHQNLEGMDLIFSQAVMEHVADIEFAYKEMYEWLRKGGIISHEVDFMTHEMTKEWNGHWYIGDNMWKLLAHGRKYPMNRLPLSAHLKCMEAIGFKIVSVVPANRKNSYEGIPPKIKSVSFTNEDMITSTALIQAVKI